MSSEIELRQLRYFLAVAEERSFTRGSRRCHVAQSSLSRQIRALELSLGTRVFERLPREIRVTPAGRILQQEAAQALEHCRRAASLVEAFEREKKRLLKIGLSSLSDLPRMQVLVRRVQKSQPALSVEHLKMYTPKLILALARGHLDLAVVDIPIADRGICQQVIHAEPLIVALPQGNPLVARPMVRIFELRKYPVVLLAGDVDPGRTPINTMLTQAGVNSMSSASSVIELLDHVAIERSIGLLRASSNRLHRDGVLFKPIGHSIQLETAVAWRTGDRNAAMTSFRDALIAFTRQMAAG